MSASISLPVRLLSALPSLALFLASAGCTGCGGSGGSDEPARPNVVLISIDSLRADHLGCYGYERDTSPAIDRLAEEGVLFEACSASTSWTLPAHAAMFTGLPDSIHGADRNGHALPEERRTLAEAFRDAGYDTAGFWSGPYLDPAFGLDQGFDEYVSCAGQSGFDLGAHEESHRDITSPRLLAAVRGWLSDRKDSERPFFLFVHMWDVHYDYVPPAPYDTRFDPDYTGPVDGRDLGRNRELQREGLPPRDLEHLIALYDGEIAWTDEHVGRILAELEGRGSTLVALTADHGEEFFEHGRFGHRRQLFEESIHVPWILRWSGELPAGARVDLPVRGVDMAPTLLDLAGVDDLPDVLGRSLAPVARGAAPATSELVLSELVLTRAERSLRAVRDGERKLILRGGEGERVPSGWYDLDADPAESEPRLDSADGAEARELAERASAELERLRGLHPPRTRAIEVPEGLEDVLKSLGYMDDD